MFTELGRLGVIGPDLASSLARMAGLRNILVDGYVAVDKGQVYSFMGLLDDMVGFARVVARAMPGERSGEHGTSTEET